MFRTDQLEGYATTSREYRNCLCVRSKDMSRPLRDRPRAQSVAIDSIGNRNSGRASHGRQNVDGSPAVSAIPGSAARNGGVERTL